jgi:hypothetical protein
MNDVEQRIEQLEAQAAEAALLAKLAGQHATRLYNALQAEDLVALANTLRARKKGRALVVGFKNEDQCQ